MNNSLKIVLLSAVLLIVSVVGAVGTVRPVYEAVDQDKLLIRQSETTVEMYNYTELNKTEQDTVDQLISAKNVTNVPEKFTESSETYIGVRRNGSVYIIRQSIQPRSEPVLLLWLGGLATGVIGVVYGVQLRSIEKLEQQIQTIRNSYEKE